MAMDSTRVVDCKRETKKEFTHVEVKCPRCGSQDVWRSGFVYLGQQRRQRYICRICSFRFSEHVQGIIRDNKNPHGRDHTPHEEYALSSRAVCSQSAGETNRTREEAKGRILELCLHMKRQAYSDETIRLNRIALHVLLDRGANLFDENSVKDVISKQTWSDNRRRNVINAYDMFVKHNGLTWTRPRCVVSEKIPFVPTETELGCLISAAGRKLSAFLQLLKETAMRRGEAERLQLVDIDAERNIVTLNLPEKHSNPRMWKVSPRLIAMLSALPKNSQRVFGDSSMDSMKSMFLTLRKKLAVKLQNPRLREINFHSFRHWKATMLMHQTHNDLYYVKTFLGHKSVKNTEIYLHMERTIFGDSGNDEFTVKVAEKPEDVKSLLEVGFEYVCQKDNLIFLRKRR